MTTNDPTPAIPSESEGVVGREPRDAQASVNTSTGAHPSLGSRPVPFASIEVFLEEHGWFL